MPFGLLSWFIAVAGWLSWAPFEGRGGGSPSFQLLPSTDLETASHFPLLIPVAIILAVQMYGSPSRRPPWQAFGVVALVGLLLELGQWWVKGRSLSPYDVLVGYMGAAVAVWGTTHAMRRGLAARPIQLSLAMLVFAIALGGIAYSILLYNQGLTEGMKLTRWEPRYAVLAGDERGGNRTYQGRVWEAQICSGEGSQKICVAPDAEVNTRDALVKMAEASQSIALSAYVWSSTDQQKGPARIVTFSKDIVQRNVTLAQHGRDLHFRVRTPWNGLNGARILFVLPDAVPTRIPTRVTGTFASGMIKLQAQSADGTVSKLFRPGILWTASHMQAKALPVMLRSHASRIGIMVFCIGLGLAIGWFVSPHWLAAVCVSLAAVLIIFVAVNILGTLAPTGFEYLSALASAAFGVALAAWDLTWIRRPPASSVGANDLHRERLRQR